ncbi:hypothetical protein LguiA_034494 [Lonicera macranthoides]
MSSRTFSPNHSVKVVDRGMGDCRLPCRRHRTSLTFIKCIPITFNAPKFMEK